MMSRKHDNLDCGHNTTTPIQTFKRKAEVELLYKPETSKGTAYYLLLTTAQRPSLIINAFYVIVLLSKYTKSKMSNDKQQYLSKL